MRQPQLILVLSREARRAHAAVESLRGCAETLEALAPAVDELPVNAVDEAIAPLLATTPWKPALEQHVQRLAPAAASAVIRAEGSALARPEVNRRVEAPANPSGFELRFRDPAVAAAFRQPIEIMDEGAAQPRTTRLVDAVETAHRAAAAAPDILGNVDGPAFVSQAPDEAFDPILRSVRRAETATRQRAAAVNAVAQASTPVDRDWDAPGTGIRGLARFAVPVEAFDAGAASVPDGSRARRAPLRGREDANRGRELTGFGPEDNLSRIIDAPEPEAPREFEPDFSERLDDLLRAEARRHGIDVEGPIR
jgi:hypothetical protein